MFRHLTEEVTKIFNDARFCFGFENQARMVQEECAELSVEVNKWFRHCGGNREHLIEEIADVYITVDQLVHNLYLEKDVETAYRAKLDRLEQRVVTHDALEKIINDCDDAKIFALLNAVEEEEGEDEE